MTDTNEPASVRVPNVRPGALAGTSHTLLDPDATAAAENATAPVIPEPETVESDTAGTGEAVNADTGETTAPGDPLPEIVTTEGEPLPPTEPPAEGTVPDDGTTGDPAPVPGEDPSGSEEDVAATDGDTAEAGVQTEGTEAPAV